MKLITPIQKVISIVLLTGIIASCGDSEDATVSNESDPTGKIQTVEVVQPKNRSFTAKVQIAGTAQPNQVVTLYAMESGVLIKIYKEIGDNVRKGEVIARLSNPALIQEQIKLQAELKAKKSTYDRLKEIYDNTPAITTLQTLEDAEAQYYSAKASLGAVNHRLAFLTIKAPFSGTVTKRFVDKGSMLQNGLSEDNPQAIVEIQETNIVRLQLPVPGSDAVAIKLGMAVDITFPELSGDIIKAKISRTSKSLDMASKTMQVEIDLNNSKGEIITGMYAKATMQIASRENILSLPILAKVKFQNEDYVMAVEDGIVKRIPVKIGLSDQDYFEVINAEITKDTKVIVTGKGLVSVGQSVKISLK
jgi:RND family efflux transporter MFP subunit